MPIGFGTMLAGSLDVARFTFPLHPRSRNIADLHAAAPSRCRVQAGCCQFRNVRTGNRVTSKCGSSVWFPRRRLNIRVSTQVESRVSRVAIRASRLDLERDDRVRL
jgi:hypothetical protein